MKKDFSYCYKKYLDKFFYFFSASGFKKSMSIKEEKDAAGKRDYGHMVYIATFQC